MWTKHVIIVIAMSTYKGRGQKVSKQYSDDELREYKKRKNSYTEGLKSIYAIASPQHIPLQKDDIDIEQSMSELVLDPSSTKNSVLSLTTMKPIFMGLCGGSGSGKTFISKWIKNHFSKTSIKICVLKEKNFLNNLDIGNQTNKESYLMNYDFDNPSAVDWELFEKAANTLEQRKPFNAPIYDLFNSKRILKTKKLEPCDIVIIEGRLIFNNEHLRNMCAVKIYLDTDVDIMLSRRVFKGLARDMDLDFIIDRYLNYVKPNYESFTEPCKVYADLVVHNFGGVNFSIEQFDNNYEILAILQDLLKFRLKDQNYEAYLVNEKMSMLAKKLNEEFDT